MKKRREKLNFRFDFGTRVWLLVLMKGILLGFSVFLVFILVTVLMPSSKEGKPAEVKNIQLQDAFDLVKLVNSQLISESPEMTLSEGQASALVVSEPAEPVSQKFVSEIKAQTGDLIKLVNSELVGDGSQEKKIVDSSEEGRKNILSVMSEEKIVAEIIDKAKVEEQIDSKLTTEQPSQPVNQKEAKPEENKEQSVGPTSGPSVAADNQVATNEGTAEVSNPANLDKQQEELVGAVSDGASGVEIKTEATNESGQASPAEEAKKENTEEPAKVTDSAAGEAEDKKEGKVLSVTTGPKEPTGSTIGYSFAAISLLFGMIFFLYSLKYYSMVAVVLGLSRSAANGNGNGNGHNGNGKNGNSNGNGNGFRNGFSGLLNRFNGNGKNGHNGGGHNGNGNGKNGRNGFKNGYLNNLNHNGRQKNNHNGKKNGLFYQIFFGGIDESGNNGNGKNGNGNGKNGNGGYRNGYGLNSNGHNGNGNGFRNSFSGLLNRFNGNGRNGNGFGNGLNQRSEVTSRSGMVLNLEPLKLKKQPFISIHLPFYNEKKVADRILKACTSFDYHNYEVVVADDSTDETVEVLAKWKKHPRVKIIHRKDRSGFKGGALAETLKITDPRTEFIVIFDADFVPYPDTLSQFLKYFQLGNGNGNGNGHSMNGYKKSNLAAVQGYQWHILNKNENWITRGVRSEFAGSYVIERPANEIIGSLKMIAGSVYMIRADLMKKYGWGTSITEDFELTLKLYADGYRVLYTPYIQAPSECVSTLKRLIRQRMRWAEGHTFNIKKYFKKILGSPYLRRREKLEFIYLAPYYLQAFFFMVGTLAWFASDALLHSRLPFWTALWGWSLVLTNLMALPLVNAVGLFLEESHERDYLGIFAFMVLSYVLVPFQALAALKGLFEKEEGPWFRTPKTGHITDTFSRSVFRGWFRILFPGRQPKGVLKAKRETRPDYLALTTAHNGFRAFKIKVRAWPLYVKNLVVNLVLILSLTLGLLGNYGIPKYTPQINNLKLASVGQALTKEESQQDLTGYKPIDNPVMMTKDALTFSQGKGVEFIFHQNPRVRIKNGFQEMEFTTLAAEGLGRARNSQGSSRKGQSFYPEIFPGINLRYTMISKGLLEEFIINKPAELKNITQQLKLTDLELVAPPNGQVSLMNQKTKKEVFKLDNPILYELNDQTQKNNGIHMELTKKNDNDKEYLLKQVIDEAGQKWLNDPARKWPVVLDPSVVTTDGGSGVGVRETEVLYGPQTKLVYSTNSSKWYAFMDGDTADPPDNWGDIYYYTSSNGTSWSGATTISDTTNCSQQSGNPSVWKDGAVLYVAWTTRDCTGTTLDDRINYVTIDTSNGDNLGTICTSGTDLGTITGTSQTSVAVVASNVYVVNDYKPTLVYTSTSSCSFANMITGSSLTTLDRPVLTAFSGTLQMIFQPGSLRWSRCIDGNDADAIVCNQTGDWTPANQVIDATNGGDKYALTTDGTNIWVHATGPAGGFPATATSLYTCGGSCDALTDWSTLTTPFTGQTNITSVSLTLDTTNNVLYAHVIMDNSEQAYFRSTTSPTSPSWGDTNSYGFTAGDLGQISAPPTVTASTQVGVVVRQGTNYEFATVPEQVLGLIAFALILPWGLRKFWRFRKLKRPG